MWNISLEIGNLNFTFITPSKQLFSVIKRSYAPFVKDGKSGIIISATVLRRKLSRKVRPDILFTGKTLQITRDDFYSSTAADFGKTNLEVELNKYSLDSWLRVFITCLAQRKKGFLLHASGYTIKNNSYIFPGVSGSGKSTIIKILGKDNALSDELLYIFFTGSRFHAASTPFWGELKKPCDLRAGHFPIRSFLFLKHGPALELNKMNVKHSFKELLKTVMFFSSRGSDFDRLIDNVIPALSDIPSYTMYFSRNNKRKTVMKALEGI